MSLVPPGHVQTLLTSLAVRLFAAHSFSNRFISPSLASKSAENCWSAFIACPRISSAASTLSVLSAYPIPDKAPKKIVTQLTGQQQRFVKRAKLASVHRCNSREEDYEEWQLASPY